MSIKIYYHINLEDGEKVIFDHGQQKLSGYHFYFEKEDTSRFEEIKNNLLK